MKGLMLAIVLFALLAGGVAQAATLDEEDAQPEGGAPSGDAPSGDIAGLVPRVIAGVSVGMLDGACGWREGMAVDGDGAPNAYGPNNSGLDYTANAGKPGKWWGVVTGSDGEPIIAPSGMYVSTTALIDSSYPRTDQRRYVDASTVPYLALGSDVLAAMGAAKGDLAMVRYRGALSGAIVADIAPKGHLHEGSIALARTLGIPSSPRNGGVKSGVDYLLFPGSSAGWPTDVLERAEAHFLTWGGAERFDALLGGL